MSEDPKLRTEISGLGPIADTRLSAATPVEIGLTQTQRQQLTTTKTEPDEHPDDRKLRLHKERVQFWVGLLVLLAALGGSIVALILVQSADEKRWLQSVVTLIIGGYVGYWRGGK